MSDSPNTDPDLTTDTPGDTVPDDAPDVEVTSPDEVDPDDGTDDDDVPVDNPAG
ncbi:hypothetical protein EDF46_3494 [Frondihabitans sp. PhB188]|uniref:hypothetical protein n=1 Tax=Frondihabitans sp. PhB188 TaxID=2485200 RepID=UPI000F9221A4|nr:hypothetical protein [Frondihabitans sp. PhB188]ROQ30982.1 hypothetical protein EDF46_3494 [Frondihabitans sp. PhB188]